MRAKKLVTVGGVVFLVLLGFSGFRVVQRSFSQSSSSYAKGSPAGSVGPVVPAKVTAAAQGSILAAYGRLPLSFEVNQGQADGRVKFLARGSGYTLRLTTGEAVLSLRKEGSPQHTVSPRRNIGASGTLVSTHAQRSTVGTVEFATLRIGLAGANPRPRVVGVDELPGKTNYFVGNNPANWHTQIPTYARVKYESIYPGIDLIYHGRQGQLEYDFAIAPGADPRAIRLSIEPRRNLRLDAAGDLVADIGGVEIRQPRPHVFQEVDGRQKEIPGRYVLAGRNEVRFDVARYDSSKPLVIDPALVYWSHVGGSTSGITLDLGGNAYVTGTAVMGTLSATPGAFQTSASGENAFVVKLDPTGTALVYATFLGGNGRDDGNGIAVDSAGNAYVAGDTTSSNFPTTPGAFQSKFVGGVCSNLQGGTCPDAFVTVLNATGTALVYSTYLGGSGEDVGNAIAVDSGRKVYVSGFATHADFPTTPGALDTTLSGGAVFVSKIDATLSGNASLVYSTFLFGGSRNNSFPDAGKGIAVDSAGEAYVAGLTYSPGVGTPGAFQPTQPVPSNQSPFVSKLNASGSALVYATYLGGTKTATAMCTGVGEFARAIAVDSAGNAYVTGNAQTTDFPTTPGAFQRMINGNDDAFVAKLNAQGTALVYSTLLGGSASGQDDGLAGPCGPFEFGTGITIDSAGNAYVTGATLSSDFPLTSTTLQTECTTPNFAVLTNFGTCGAFVTILNATGGKLLFSTFIGGPADFLNLHFPQTTGVAVDKNGNIYLSGSDGTNYAAVPTLANSSCNGCNGLTAKVSPSGTAPAVGLFPVELDFGSQAIGVPSPPQKATLTNRGNGPLNITGITTEGDTGFTETNNCSSPLAPGTSCTVSITIKPAAQGRVAGDLKVSDDAFNSPQFVLLTGGGGTPSVSLSASSLTFANPGVGTTSAPQTITVSDVGTANLIITSIATTGDFAQTNNCGTSPSAGASCMISVTFTPTAAGPRSGTLIITDNAADSPQQVLLGGGFGVAASPASATVTAGQKTSYSLTITPAGTFNQTASLSCTGAPAHATCTVSPASVNLNGGNSATAMVNVTTMARSTGMPERIHRWLWPRRSLREVPPALLILLLFAGLINSLRTHKRLAWRSVAAMALLLGLLCAACGGGGNGGGGSNGTPAGTYKLTVTATSGSVSSSTTLTLVVD